MINTVLNFIDNKKTQNTAIAILLLILLYALHLALFFGVGGRDDSYITYWSAYSLSEMGEIVNYNGDRIEQSSSLLHVLLLAALHTASGLSIPTLGIIFSSTCGIATALLAGRLARDIGIIFYKWIPFVIVFVPYFSYWSSSGMETSLAALCIVLFLTALKIFLANPVSKTNFLYILFSIALYILVRPESAIILLVFFSALAFVKLFNQNNPNLKNDLKKIIGLALIVAILFACLAVWRQFYFGQIFPQPVYAKTDLVHWVDRVHHGLRYLEYSLNFSTTLMLLSAIAGLTTLFIKNKKNTSCTIKHSIVFLSAYLAFVICSGGDWMEGRRLLVPVIPVLCLLALAGVNKKNIGYPLLVLFFCFALIDSWRFSKQESIGLPPAHAVKLTYIAGQINSRDTKFLGYGFNDIDNFNFSHLRDMLTIPVLDTLMTELSKDSSEPVYVVSRQMGMIPYYIASKHYKKVRFIDLRGLVTKDIPDCHFISDSKPKSTSGVLITSRHYLDFQQQISNDCSLPLADVIYDTGFINNSVEETTAVLSANGYRLYYAQGNTSQQFLAQYIGINQKYKNIIP